MSKYYSDYTRLTAKEWEEVIDSENKIKELQQWKGKGICSVSLFSVNDSIILELDRSTVESIIVTKITSLETRIRGVVHNSPTV